MNYMRLNANVLRSRIAAEIYVFHKFFPSGVSAEIIYVTYSGHRHNASMRELHHPRGPVSFHESSDCLHFIDLSLHATVELEQRERRAVGEAEA